MGKKIMEFEFSKEFLDRFKSALNDRDAVYIRDSLDGVRSADICEILTEIGIEYSKYVFDIISPDIAADILVELEEDFRVEFMEYFTINELAYFIEILDSDDGADILNKMSWTDEGHTYFRMDDFYSFCKRNNWEMDKIKTGNLIKTLKDVFVKEERITLKNQTPRLVKIKAMKKTKPEVSQEKYQETPF